MNSYNAEAKKYYKKDESFMNKNILYIKMLYTKLISLLEIKLQKAKPCLAVIAIHLKKAKGFIMDLFLRDLICNIKNIWDKTDFTKPYPLSSKYGIAYVFLIVVALNLTGFNILLTGSKGMDTPAKGANILNTVKIDSNNSGVGYSLVAELEIFQQIIRHSDMDQHLALKLASIIKNESQKYGIDPYIILSVIQVESRFSPGAVSNKGARGLMQVMPTTGRYVANKFDLPLKNTRSLFDPVTNIRLGVAYLSYLENMYGNMDYALFAYNHGPKKTKQIKKTFSKSKPYYVKAVMNFKEFLETERLVTES
jgi:hypothetical protein